MKKLFRELTNPRMGSNSLVNPNRRSKSLKRRSLHDRILGKIQRIETALIVLTKTYCLHNKAEALFRLSISKFLEHYETRGLKFTISWMKYSRLIVTRYLSGNALNDPDPAFGVKVIGGLPNWLAKSYKEELIRLDETFYKTLLTALSISRCFTLKAEPDISPIVSKSNFKLDSISDEEIEFAAKELKFRTFDCSFVQFHSTTKSGPNDQALLSALNDLTLLPPSLQGSIVTIAGERLVSKMENIINFYLESWGDFDLIKWFYTAWRSKEPRKFRKLSYFADKEGKTRVIAILDYWSQTALKSLHENLNDLLKRIECDCTFNQNHFHNCLRSGPYHSLDLHAATDRMPIALQKRVLRLLIGEDRADAWESILVGSGFHLERNRSTETILYEVGQPMGAYSSWPVMAVTHHVLVKISAKRAGITKFCDYAILGDDVVIANDMVAVEYRRLLLELDMPISEAKTHVSLNLYEFAKRWVYKGKEITPYSISSVLETWKNYPMFLNSVETQQQHGWVFLPSEGPGSFLEKIMKAFGKWGQAPRTRKLLDLHILLQKTINDFKNIDNHLDVEGHIDKIWSICALPETRFNKYEFVRKVLINRMVEQCAEDKIKLLESQKGYLALMAKKIKELNLEARVTSRLREVLIDNTPISGVFTSQEIKYERELQMLKENDPVKALEVYESKVLSGSAFNLGVFSMRNSHSRVLAKARMVKDFLNYTKDLLRLKDLDPYTNFPEPKIKEMIKLEKVVNRLKLRRASNSESLFRAKEKAFLEANEQNSSENQFKSIFEPGAFVGKLLDTPEVNDLINFKY